MKLDKLPSIIENNKFNEKGLVETDSGLLVPAYVGSQMGFNEPGRYYIDNFFYPKLRELGVLVLCPFAACREYLDFSKLDNAKGFEDKMAFWNEFNRLTGPVNYETLMPHSKFMIALMEGHAVDDGLSSEISHYVGKYGYVIGIRSDFRLAENIAAPINPALRYFLDYGPYKDKAYFFYGPDVYKRAFEKIEALVREIRES